MINSANSMLHRGPFHRLTATMNQVPVFSTCLLLLLQSQIFHALPTSSSSIYNDDIPLPDKYSAQGAASSPASSYQPAYSYGSYRPGAGLDSYRPYRNYYPKEDAAPAGLYLGGSSHPNSVYSPPSITLTPQNQQKMLQFIERELAEQESRQKLELKVTPSPKNDQDTISTTEQIYRIALPRRQDNRPRLAPLPSVVGIKEHVVKVEENKEDKHHLEPLPSDPIPPPFAPELDPQYERKLYGLGALTLLDQAGPFW